MRGKDRSQRRGRIPFRAPSHWVVSLIASLCAAAPSLVHAQSSTSTISQLRNLSISQLLNVTVTSVSKQAQPLSDAPAAVYVITHAEIVRSGATTIPEILRLAPNLQVVRISPSNYTITARGFSGNSADQNFSNKLLVLVDGRSVYSPLYSGVYWDALDVNVEDIERVEVISGPGATLWGANAVNGVINIITRSAADTQGVRVSVAEGNLERRVNAQYGGHLADQLSYRIYASGFRQNSFDLPSGRNAQDGWWKTQVGFRSDWHSQANAVMVQGDTYRANESAPANADTQLSGVDLLGRWNRALSDSSNLQVLAYYDQSQRFTIGGGAFVLNTYDLELQHSFAIGRRNAIVWGAGDRVNSYSITNTPTFQFRPDSRGLNLLNVFGQDSITLAQPLKLVVGLKLEDDPYTGMTPLPDARLAWKVTDSTLLWAAASRAIRSATPFDRDVAEYLSGMLFLVGGPNFQPERLTAYQLGYRGQIGPRLSLSVSTYYNSYDDLRSIEYGPHLLPLQWGNKVAGHTYGVELWGNLQVMSWWRLAFGFDQLHEDFHFLPGSSGLLGVAQEGDDPDRQASLRSSIILGPVTLETDFRYVSALPNPAVPGYTECDANLDWALSRRWTASLAGFNLLQARHQEFTFPPSDLIDRSVLLSLRYGL